MGRRGSERVGCRVRAYAGRTADWPVVDAAQTPQSGAVKLPQGFHAIAHTEVERWTAVHRERVGVMDVRVAARRSPGYRRRSKKRGHPLIEGSPRLGEHRLPSRRRRWKRRAPSRGTASSASLLAGRGAPQRAAGDDNRSSDRLARTAAARRGWELHPSPTNQRNGPPGVLSSWLG